MRKVLLATLAITGFLIIFFVDKQYRNQIEQDNTRLLELVMQDAKEDLELSINNKLNAVNDLRAFLLLDPKNPNPATFTRFSATLSQNYPEVRAFQYTDTNLIIRHIYPLEGNEAALDLDLKTTTSLPFVEKAINERITTISDPVISAQGPWVTVLRAPLYNGDEFFGLAQVVVDIDALASQFSIVDREEIIFQILDGQGTVIKGPEQIPEPSLSTPVAVGDNTWSIKIAWAIAPYQVNSLITAFIWGTGSLLTLTLLYTGYQIWWRTQLLGIAVAERTVELEKEVTRRAQVEQDLRAYQAALDRSQKIAGMGSWELDLETDVFSLSEAAKPIYGLEPDEELTRELLNSMMHPDDQKIRREYDQQIEEKGKTEVEHRLVMKDGSTRWLWVQSQLEYNAEGKPIKSLGTSIDITKRKQAELALARAQKIAGMGSWEHNIETDVFTSSETAKIIYALEPGEEMSMEWLDTYIHPDDQQKRLEYRQRLAEEGHAEFELRLLMKDGSTRWFWMQSQREYNPDGKPLRTVGTSIDITERKQAELALARAQEIAGMGSWERYLKTDVFITSAAARAVYGLEPGEELTIELLNSMMHPDDEPARTQYRQRLKAEGKAEFEHRLILRDGSIRWLWLQSQMEYDAGGIPIKTVGTAIDITKRKQAELALDRQYKRLSSLHEIDLAIISSLDLELTLNVLARQITEQLEVDAANFLQYIPHQRLEVVAQYGFQQVLPRGTSLNFNVSIAGKVAQTRQARRVQDVSEEDFPPNLNKLFQNEGFSSFYALPVEAGGELLGVLELFNKQPFPEDIEWRTFLETLIGQAAIAIQNALLVTNLQRAKQELEIAYDATLEGWVLALDLRDKETEGHTRRVTNAAMVLARALGVPSEQLVHIRRGALLHDIGKLAVPDEILHKPGPLTEEEWVIMRAHTTYAHNFMKHIDYLHPACDIPFHHHERWDGSGYPDGLKGEDIPLAARLFAIVDVWDALSNDRPYRKAWEPEKVRRYLLEQSGKHFDPQVVTAFMEQVLKLREKLGDR